MSKKKPKQENKLSAEELQVFRDEVSNVQPLISEKRIETVKKQMTPRPVHDAYLNEQAHQPGTENMSDPIDLRDVAVDDVLSFARSGIQQKVQKKLKRGEFPIEDELDLHGYTVVEAKTALQVFLSDCKRQHIRYIRIIHGKGYRSEQKIPVIKTHVAYWLPQLHDVLAFSSARPADGGTGAIYVILKSTKTNR